MDKLNNKLTLDKLAGLTEELAAEMQRLSTALAVHDSAYVLLARHLAVQGLVQPVLLAGDLKMMGGTEPGGAWQGGHQGLAAALLFAHGLPSGGGPRTRPGGR